KVAYYGLLQLFLTPRSLYLLVWDAEKACQMNELDLEDLGIAPWLRYLTFRVPDADVVLVGNKWDRVEKAKRGVVLDVEHESREILGSWRARADGYRPGRLTLEEGVSCVSCAWSVPGVLASIGLRTGWPCDKSMPGLFHRIVHMPSQVGDSTAAVGDTR
ncbi:unnamed protein product, partial [Sphacelaria rigidula]